ncbi:hypothetical protein LBMAG44_20190 [Gemmatimonadota bacterium]|nr:hypothetical protein LBMAG44_20190 [Gemmatimonadota bacterium]
MEPLRGHRQRLALLRLALLRLALLRLPQRHHDQRRVRLLVRHRAPRLARRRSGPGRQPVSARNSWTKSRTRQ